MSENKFIVIEATDGAGKDTLGRELSKRLTQINIPNALEHEPTDPETLFGRTIRSVLQGKEKCSQYELQELFSLDRKMHENKIKELLKDYWVICTRYKYSTIAFSEALHLLDPTQMTKDNFVELIHVNTRFTDPDLILLLDMPVEKSLQRIESRGDGKELFDTKIMQEQVRKSYLNMFRNNNSMVKISAEGTIEEVAQMAFDIVKTRFGI